MILTITLNSCLHKYMLFRVEGPLRTVIRPVESRLSSGGKGFNAARVIRRLGGEVCALGLAGGWVGRQLGNCLEEEGVPVELVETQATTRMSVCLFERTEGRFRELLEPGEDATAEEAEQLRIRFRELLPTVSWVTLNGSSPGPELDPLFAEFAAEARQQGKRVLLDSYGNPAPLAAEVPPHWIRGNWSEVASTYGISSCENLRDFHREQKDRGLTGVLVTRGAEEIHCFCREGGFLVVPPKVEEVNPVGSGDALTGAFVLALARGEDVVTALRWGAAAGSANAAELLVCDFGQERWAELLDQVEVRELGH